MGVSHLSIRTIKVLDSGISAILEMKNLIFKGLKYTTSHMAGAVLYQ